MRGDPEVIGPKWAIRFRDLSGWHRIHCKCFACNHLAELAPEQLKQLQLRRLMRKFRSMARRGNDAPGPRSVPRRRP